MMSVRGNGALALAIVLLAEQRGVSGLTATQAQQVVAKALGRSSSGTRMAPEFYGAFSQGESTYDEDAVHSSNYVDGWGAQPTDAKASPPGGRPAEWFHESDESMSGPRTAWQTHYPATGIGRKYTQPGVWKPSTDNGWKLTGGGNWVQDYHSASKAKFPQAEWFDSSVAQYDNMGRAKMPHPLSPARQLLWQERVANTTLTCGTLGCEASVQLKAYDPSTEEASHCKVSLALHPTDFDDLYSGERLEWIKINNALVNTDCYPMQTGCNASSQAKLFYCLRDHPVDSFLNASGEFTISTKISDTVDECPYEGNLLAAVPSVTCFVRPKPPPTAAAPPPSFPAAPAPLVPIETTFNASGLLQCAERGCEASTSIDLVRPGLNRTQCNMTLTLYQTDFDRQEGSNELVEFIRLGSNNTLATNVTPGGNPCRSTWGTTGLASNVAHVVASDVDVMPDIIGDRLNIAAKISPYVDECAYQGYLLNGRADVVCKANRLTTWNLLHMADESENTTTGTDGTDVIGGIRPGLLRGGA